MSQASSLKFTVLGCGSSGGVPRIAHRLENAWGACDPKNPKNRRTRCSLLIEKTGRNGGVTRVLIDTSPDLRCQLLNAGLAHLDGVVYTHAHADHLHGIDDLRMVYFERGSQLPVWADQPTHDDLLLRFDYIFKQPEGSSYPPICCLNELDGPCEIDGAGGPLRLEPLQVQHGRIAALGFRIGALAYIPDVSSIPETTWEQLEGLDTFVLDALRYEPHPSHSHLEQSLAWIERAAPRHAILTNLHIDLDYEALGHLLPSNVEPAFDGLSFEVILT